MPGAVSPVGGKAVRVLVADDDPGSRLVAQGAVQALGHECFSAEDGARAWELVLAERPDVLITDRTMPGLDGLELCRRVRARSGDGYTYIVLLTAHDQPQDVLDGMQAGADDYLAKPLDPVGLQARLLAARRVTDLHSQLSRTRGELFRQAHTDPLTGLRNRLSLGADLDELHRLSARYGRSYCLALCDVDFFKRYNDTYGHPAGDQALRGVAATLAEQLRDVDRIYRYGGEEFLVLLPEQGLVTAAAAMQRVRTRQQSAAIQHRKGGPFGVLTLSIGISSADAAGRQAPGDVLAAADAALYDAKAGGRNQVAFRRPARTEKAAALP